MKSLLTLSLIFTFHFSFGQNPYAVNVQQVKKDTSSNLKISEFAHQFKYLPINDWKQGMKFMPEEDTYGNILGYEKDFELQTYKSKNLIDKLKAKDFKYQIFTLKTIEERTKDRKVALIFENNGKFYEHIPILPQSIDELKKYADMCSIRGLVYIGEIDTVKSQLVGKKLWVLSKEWFRQNETSFGMPQKDGEQYIPITITQIGMGQQNAPIRIAFKAEGKDEAFIDIYLSAINQDMKINEKHFDEAFSFTDPKLSHPSITNDNWRIIQQGHVKIGMTEEECKLSWGKPTKTNATVMEGLATEQWIFGESVYLYFRNGILTSMQD